MDTSDSSHSIIHSIYTRNGLQGWLQSRGLRATKALGQNFLYDKNVILAILDALELDSHNNIIEIGPGLGHLTWQLLEIGLNVTAIELDNTFIRSLTDMNETRISSSESTELNIIRQDALTVDYSGLSQEIHAKHVIGNLPYNISVPLMFQLAKTQPTLEGIHVMIQKEVGERILAKPSSKEYGRLSIVLNYLCDITLIRTVPPSVFLPPPKISSVFLSLNPKSNLDYNLADRYLERLVQLGFSHRRKKLRSQLKNAIIEKRVLNTEFMKKMEPHFNLDCRAEQLDVDMWVKMARFIQAQPPADA